MVQKLTVLGAGTMGHGIAEVAALSGFDVCLRDIEEQIVRDGMEQIEWSLNKLAEKDIISAQRRDDAREVITPLVDLEEAVRDTDVVIEAIVERMDIKKQVYRELDDLAPEEAIFASNTSSLSITDLSEVTDRPDRFCGMHFFNPPVRMDLVEVIRGSHTSDETIRTIEDLAEEFGKTPVRVRKDEPGFIVNRVLLPLLNEAFWMVEEEVALMTEVDSTTRYMLGLPMGAFELSDQVGNDVNLHILDYMHEELGDAYEPASLLREKVEAEELGKKTGRGFYDYENGGTEVPPDEGRDDIKARLLAVMANEVGGLLENEVAPVEDVDRAMKLGAAFPEGPARMADGEGLDVLIEALESAGESTGAARYEVSEGLRDAAEQGGFYGGNSGNGSQDFETIRLESLGREVGRIVLDRPQQLNTVTERMLEELDRALDRLEADDDVRVVLISGAGDRAFCAGADVNSMFLDATPTETVRLIRRGQRVFGRLEQLPMPVIAGVDGYALGGGMELAAAADLRVATWRSTFGQPEHDLGVMPGWGGTQRLGALIGEGRAKEVIFTRRQYDAETLREYGFLNEVVDPDGFEDALLELAEELASGAPLAQEYTKRAFLVGRDDTDAGLEVEAQGFGHLVGTEDFTEGVSKLRSDEDPEFKGE